MTSSRSYSPDSSFATAANTPRPTSRVTVSDDSTVNQQSIVPTSTADQTLKPGVYKILNDTNPESAIDLSGHDLKTIIAYGSHEGKNQKWSFARLGPGYSIQSCYNGAYITLESGIGEGGTMIATPYPVSWAIEADDFEAGIWRIRWPNSAFMFDLPGGSGHSVQLSNRYPFRPTRLWRLILVEDELLTPSQPSILEFATTAPKKLEPGPPLITTADTVIDAEGLMLGGNGEMSITTTTTTVTTSVTVVKRIGTP